MLTNLIAPLLPGVYPLFILPGKVIGYGRTPFWGRVEAAGPRLEPVADRDQLVPALSRLREALLPGNEDAWLVGLPLRYFTLVDLRLPEAARDDLDQAVRYALMRHAPMGQAQVRIAYQVAEDGGNLDLNVAAALHDQLDPVLDALAEAGIRPTRIFPALVGVAAAHGLDGAYVSGGQGVGEVVVLDQGRVALHFWDDLKPGRDMEGFLREIRPMLDNRPRPVDRVWLWECRVNPEAAALALGLKANAAALVEPGFTRTGLEQIPYGMSLGRAGLLNRRALALRAGAVGLLILALALFPLGGLLGKRAHLKQLEADIARIRPQAEAIAEKRREMQDYADFLRRIAQVSREQPAVLELVHELTQILPGNAWLDSFIFAQGRVRIQGQADSATSIIEAMENSPLFQSVRFESPVTRSGNRDVFQISADLQE